VEERQAGSHAVTSVRTKDIEVRSDGNSSIYVDRRSRRVAAKRQQQRLAPEDKEALKRARRALCIGERPCSYYCTGRIAIAQTPRLFHCAAALVASSFQ
jgi:hypothetical protein